MGAFSFKRRFVVPIAKGLGHVSWPSEFDRADPTKIAPKRQTVRRVRVDGRVCKPGEVLALYYAQRTKQCYLIGRARCIEAQPVSIKFSQRRRSDWLRCARLGKIDRPYDLDEFARSDGFADWAELRAFWRDEHPGVESFDGVITFWEPLA